MDEEVVLLEEQLASAHAEIERLESRLADAAAGAAEAAGQRRELEAARAELAQAEALQASQAAEIEALRAALTLAEEQVAAAAWRYREAVLAQEPQLPADLVAGDTVDAIDASVQRARQTVEQVRQHIEQQAQALRVPAGAPVRTGVDISGLSSAEKIRLGLQQA